MTHRLGFPGEKVKKKEGAEDGGEVGSLRNGKKSWSCPSAGTGWEGLGGDVLFVHDELELAVGHPGRFMSRRGRVETSACESSEER